ncbi:MAG TPA: undecaprenyl-diphosphate phosphatase [Methylomirabilota bacterium]|nr:undecaprenyl-diphosphate phosphatase [Methylomirabilota bacterium]
MDILQSLLLAIVEGIAEFLPISSTGHLILASDILKIAQTDFVKSFEIIIQLGAILAIVVLYAQKLFGRRKLWLPLLAAFIPTAVIGFVLFKLIKNFLLGNTAVTLWALLIGGIVLIIAEKFYKEQPHHLDDIEKLSPKKAVLIGLAQSISVIPGVSRSAATILGGLFVGLKRKPAVEFSFLLAIPTMIAATGLDLVKSNFSFSSSEWGILAVGFVGAFITALLAVKYFLRFIQHHTFIPFGIYRIIVAILFWLLIIR